MMSSRAVVAGDLRRTGLEVDVGDAVERGEPAAGGRHAQVPDHVAGRCGRVSGRRTRIGMRRSPTSSLATLASMSPTVATRATWAMVSALTPSRAASSGLRPDDQLRRRRRGGRPRVGEVRAASRISRCSSSAAASRPSPLSLVSDHLHVGARRSPALSKVTRASGMCAEAGRRRSRICGTLASRSGFSTATTAPLVTPPLADGAAEAAAGRRADCGEDVLGLRLAAPAGRSSCGDGRRMSASVAPGGASMST